MKEGEHFFGVLTQKEFIELEKEKARHVYTIIKQRMDSDTEQIGCVTIFGELFGGKECLLAAARPLPDWLYIQSHSV